MDATNDLFQSGLFRGFARPRYASTEPKLDERAMERDRILAGWQEQYGEWEISSAGATPDWQKRLDNIRARVERNISWPEGKGVDE